MNKILIAFFTIVLGCYLLTLESSTPNEPQKGVIEFQFKDEELLEMNKWQDKSASDIYRDAFECDRAALYMLGMSFVRGPHIIDAEKADFFFVRSASLGFAPSIKQIINKNFEDDNCILGIVYCNLLISLGHQEYVTIYHKLKVDLLHDFGPRIITEIERIALEKYTLINCNIEKFKKAEDKRKFFLSMSTNGFLIDSQDENLDAKYWVHFSKQQAEAKEITSKFQSAVNNDLKSLRTLCKQSSQYLELAIDCYKKGKEFSSKLDALKNVAKAMSYADKLKDSMESLKDVPHEDLRKAVHEILSLSENSKVVLEQHYKFFSSPEDVLDSDIKIFIDASQKAEIHNENVEEMIKKLKASNR